MRPGLLLSIILHIMAFLLIMFKLPEFTNDLKHEYLIVTDIITISDVSNAPVKQSSKSEPKNTRKQQAPKSVDAKKTQETAQPEKAAEKIPEKITPKEKKQEIKKPEKAEKKEPKKQQKNDDLDPILKNLQEAGKKNDSKNDKKIDNQLDELLEKALDGKTNKKFNPNLQLSMSEKDSVISQIKERWSTLSFAGAPDVKDFKVTLIGQLNIDGSVKSCCTQNEQSNSSTHYRSFVESAKRAINAAAPLKNLSKEKYEDWKDFDLTFYGSGLIY